MSPPKPKKIKSKTGKPVRVQIGPKLIIYVKNPADEPIDGVKVIARHVATNTKYEATSDTLDKHVKPNRRGTLPGVAYFSGQIQTGQYRIYLDGWDPGDDRGKDVTVVAGDKDHNRRKPHNEIILPLKKLNMYLDADRDGIIDDAPVNYDEWGKEDAPGAVVLVNTINGPDSQNLPTHRRNVKYAPDSDVMERLEIRFRWEGNACEERDGWHARLTADHPDRLKIYDSKKANAVELNLAAGVDIKAQPEINKGREFSKGRQLWVEAAQFPDNPDESQWLIKLTYTFTSPEGNDYVQHAQLRIAPWIMSGDLDKIRIVCFGKDNPKKPSGIGAAINRFVVSANVTPKSPHFIVGKPFLRDVFKSGSINGSHHSTVVLMRYLDSDDRNSYRAVSNLFANANIQNGPLVGTIPMPGAAETAARTSQDNGGNLLVSPPSEGYPFGRIIYGQGNSLHAFDPAETPVVCHPADFFKAQKVQKPIELNSAWLSVGHVDEFISFVPDLKCDDPIENWPYKILIASPRLGLALAHSAAVNHNPDNVDAVIDRAREICEESRQAKENWENYKKRLKKDIGTMIHTGGAEKGGARVGWANKVDGYSENPPVPAGTNGKIVEWSDGKRFDVQSIDSYLEASDMIHKVSINDVDPILEACRTRLCTDLCEKGDWGPRDAANVIEIPVLLQATMGGFSTKNADSVNMLVISSINKCKCLVPKPFGPVCGNTYIFERDIERKLSDDMGLDINFANDWVQFHVAEGEIHCGTNHIPDIEKPIQWWMMDF